MALNIRNPDAERLAAELARLTGKTKTQAVTDALREQLKELRASHVGPRFADELGDIARHCASVPVQDDRSTDEILGYGDRGLPR